MQSNLIEYLTLDEVLEIHSRLIERFGGQAGIRDSGLLLSALYRPQTGYYKDLAEMGAALFESLIISHPFVDGNKRVAFFGTDVFCRMNGYRFEVDADETHDFLIYLIEASKCNYDNLLPWVRDSVKPYN